MLNLWDLLETEDVPGSVSLRTGHVLPPKLKPLLKKLRECGLEHGHIILSLLSEIEVDPLGVWEVVYKSDVPELHVDAYLFMGGLGFFPFGKSLDICTEAPNSAYEGIVVVELSTSAMYFLRQTSALRVDTGAQDAFSAHVRSLVCQTQAQFNGAYYKVWELAGEHLRELLAPFEHQTDLKKQLLIQQLVGGIRHSQEQWQQEQENLRKASFTTSSPPDIRSAQDVLSKASEDAVVPYKRTK